MRNKKKFPTREEIHRQGIERRLKILDSITPEDIRKYNREAYRQLTWDPMVWNFKVDAFRRQN